MSNLDNKNRLPWLARRLPFYYGWLMVPIAVIGQATTGVGQTFGISVFNPSLLSSLDISLSALSGAYLVGTLGASIFQPFIGSLMDRFGIRTTMFGVVSLLGGACLFFSRVNSLITLLIGFFLLRLLGQGGLSLLAGNIPALWFREKLGAVTGIVSSGFSVSIAVLPAFFLYLIKQFGWRGAYFRLGVLVWLITLPLILILRNRPAEVGQRLDGRSESEIRNGPDPGDDKSWSAGEARRTPAYWIMLVNAALWAMVVTAVFFNLLSILSASGISDAVAAATYTTYAAAALVTQLVMGPVADRGSLQVLMMIAMGSLGAGVAVLSFADTTWLAHAYAVMIGISTGLISLLGGTLFAAYYGRANLGKLRGGMLTAQVAGSSLGPFITGLIYDLSGSFQISLWIFAGLLIPAAVLSLRAVKPEKDPSPAAG